MKMYCILRNDIYMDAGKAAAQAGHAFVGTTMVGLDTERYKMYQPDTYEIATKVVLGASLKQIEQLQKELDRTKMVSLDATIPSFAVFDSGHVFPPDFDGTHAVLTAIGIGPLFKEESLLLLGHLDLFKLIKKPTQRKRNAR